MTNTQIMELLRNEAINQDTKKALLIAIGIIVAGGIAVYFYNKSQQDKIASMTLTHANYLNFSETKINNLTNLINQMKNQMVEHVSKIKQLEDENIVLQNINKIQTANA